MRNERNSLRQAAITAGILAALGVCTLGGDWPRVWAAEPSNNAAQAEAKTAAAQDVQAAADETDGDGMDFTLEGVTVEAKRPDWEAKLSPGTVTVIRPDDYKGEQKDLPDLLKMVPGVHVRELNGKGQYTTVSVRGSTAAQVGVFVSTACCLIWAATRRQIFLLFLYIMSNGSRSTAAIYRHVLAVPLWAALSTSSPNDLLKLTCRPASAKAPSAAIKVIYRSTLLWAEAL